jgi:hypothetical protein
MFALAAGLNDVGDGEGPPVPDGLHNNIDFRN